MTTLVHEEVELVNVTQYTFVFGACPHCYINDTA